jgi:hypothetical protein
VTESSWKDTPPHEFDQMHAAARDALAVHGLSLRSLVMPSGMTQEELAQEQAAVVAFSGAAERAQDAGALLVLLAIDLADGSTALLPAMAVRAE